MAVGNFLAELKRRHVYRAGGAYAVVAFGLIEIVSNVTPMLDLPAWLGRAVILLLIVGFPLTLLAAWMIEAKPAEDVSTPSASKLDFVLAGALVLVAGLLIYQQVAPAQKSANVATAPSEGISIAVLPFVNLSGDPSQEFFSDGMTEEITSALAKVKGLRVVGRTSAFEFKGQNKDLRAIGQALGTANLLEGSVRKVGNRVRITGQLIRAGDGSHIWTENYDRELIDIFKTQDDIAQAIAGALRVPLGLQAGESLVASRTADTDSYQDYLRAKALVRARTIGTSLEEPIGLLEQVVVRDPGYAPAWALLAMAHGLAPIYEPTLRGVTDKFQLLAQASLAKAEAAGRRAVELDPRSADASLSLANALAFRGKFADAEDLTRQVLKIDPYNPDTLHLYGSLLAQVGRLKEAVAVRQQLKSLEPQVTVFNINTARVLWVSGQTDAALDMIKALPAGRVADELARVYVSMGRYKEAADVIANTPGTILPDLAAAAVRLLRAAPARPLPQEAPFLGSLTFVYLAMGLPERVLDLWARQVEGGFQPPTNFYEIFHPAYAPVRKTARFKELLRKSGHIEYWRARGWPDVCRPVGTDDFECN